LLVRSGQKQADSQPSMPHVLAPHCKDELRQVVATVGKVGQPGEHVRCVVSVGMLTEAH